MDHWGILSVCMMWVEHLHHSRKDVPLQVRSALQLGPLQFALDDRLLFPLCSVGSEAITPVTFCSVCNELLRALDSRYRGKSIKISRRQTISRLNTSHGTIMFDHVIPTRRHMGCRPHKFVSYDHTRSGRARIIVERFFQTVPVSKNNGSILKRPLKKTSHQHTAPKSMSMYKK